VFLESNSVLLDAFLRGRPTRNVGISDHVFETARATQREAEPDRERKPDLPITGLHELIFAAAKVSLCVQNKSYILSVAQSLVVQHNHGLNMICGACCCGWDALIRFAWNEFV